jgi:hypothetical protein
MAGVRCALARSLRPLETVGPDRVVAGETSTCAFLRPNLLVARSGSPPSMCTMALSGHYLHGQSARTLVACCDSAGVELSQHHSALDDAPAATQLSSRFRASHGSRPESWQSPLTAAMVTRWIPAPGEERFEPVTPRGGQSTSSASGLRSSVTMRSSSTRSRAPKYESISLYTM